MTRKDYVLIAEVLKGSRPAPYTDLENLTSRNMWSIWRTTSRNMADALASDNPRFDRARFLEACGV